MRRTWCATASSPGWTPPRVTRSGPSGSTRRGTTTTPWSPSTTWWWWRSGDARAFSSDGDALWSEQSPGVDASVSVGALSDDSVFLNTSDYDGDVTSEQVTVFDAEGEVGEIGIDDDTSFYGFAFESGGVRYLLNESDGTLYDDTLDRVGSYGGRLAVADSGIYSLDGDRLRFYEYGENAAAWEVDVDGSDSLSVMAGDGVVLVSDERSVTAYR